MGSQSVYKIIPGIQHYAWGGASYIPEWLGVQNHDSKPYAEAWYGDHPLASAQVILDNTMIPLHQIISKDPASVLGQESIDTYGPRMPFLLKILDVKEMLSLQLHPTRESAVKGYARENELGIPLNASHRNYKDQNHKPEILFALSDFWMLQGFASMQDIEIRFKTMIPEFNVSPDDGWKACIQSILDLSGQDYIACTQTLFKNLSNQDCLDKNQIYHWISKAFKAYPPDASSIDRGLLLMLMLHVQYLQPGQVAYQAPGVLHAYLEGQNIELMANSDNVLRGGLTPKHIDPKELMCHLDSETSGQCMIKPIYLMDDEVAFNPPVHDFWLKQFVVAKGKSKGLQFNTVAILLNKSGDLKYNDEPLRSGESILIPACTKITVETVTEQSEYFLAVSSV